MVKIDLFNFGEKIMRLSNIFLAVVLTVTVSVAHAIPNMWGSGFTMGVTEFSIDNGKWGINISCTGNPNENNVLAHTIYIYKGDKVVANSGEKNISFVIDGEEFWGVVPDGTRMNDNAWVSFVKAISTATGFELYINEKKVATFNPSAKNVKKVMDNNFIQSCWNTWYE
ncbi:hypothetical protein U8458_004086 [Escherichia coli]|nr:hypothetical protein [Escherichia coli]